MNKPSQGKAVVGSYNTTINLESDVYLSLTHHQFERRRLDWGCSSHAGCGPTTHKTKINTGCKKSVEIMLTKSVCIQNCALLQVQVLPE